MTDGYEPKLIMTPDQYDDYLLMLHRDLARMAENLDPPNPFRGLVQESDGIAIRINDTNDLHYAITYMENLIEEDQFKHIILADPRPIGYSFEILEKMGDETKFPCQWMKTNDWIIFILNTDEQHKLVIKENKFFIKE